MINPYEYLGFCSEIDSIGGSLHIVPVHATVTMFGRPSGATHDTITTGTGNNIVPGFHTCFVMGGRSTFCFRRARCSAFLVLAISMTPWSPRSNPRLPST
jgi:hypothetical protein